MSKERVIRYMTAPLVILICFTILIFVSLWYSRRRDLHNFDNTEEIILTILVFGVQCYSSIYLSRDKVQGPKNMDNTVQLFAVNGVIFWFLCICTFLLLCYFYQLDMLLFKSHFYISLLNTITAIGLCIFLFIRGKRELKNKPLEIIREPSDSNYLHQYYRGTDFHPKFFGDVDIKQFTNCKWGIISWQILILSFAFASFRTFGFNWGILASLLLQTAYIAKFFYQEIGYFYTLDANLDRAGHYISWGCLLILPSLYTLSMYSMANNPPQKDFQQAFIFFVIGSISLVFNFWVDFQKLIFQKTNGQCFIWGKPTKYIKVKYQKEEKQLEGRLMISGFWGKARKLNYTFEVLLAFSWSVIGIDSGLQVMIYFFYLLIFLILRLIKDEEKCEEKYGEHWLKYCKKVPFRFIPKVF